MKWVETTGKISREALSSDRYFESLLKEAYQQELLWESQLEKIQWDCLSLLAEQTERYQGGGSSSIPVETAQDLLESIFFTLGVRLKTFDSPDRAVEALEKEGVIRLYQGGLQQIRQSITWAKNLHASILENLVSTKNVFYRSTIDDGMKGFFKLYDPDFSAQEIHITADYPVYPKMETLRGIEFIQRYLECIYYENLFCSRFSSEDIHRLLSGYGYDQHYEELLFNIYEPVLAAALGGVLTGLDFRRLEMNPSGIELLSAQFHEKTGEEILQILKEAAEELRTRMKLYEPLFSYLSESLPKLASSTALAVRLKTLERVFLIPKWR